MTRPADRGDDGFRRDAKKHLGQNFLHDRGVIARIVQAIDPRPGDALVEIGPGRGALTFPLLDRHGALTAIEFDRDLHAPLQAAARAHGDLRLVEGDVLAVECTIRPTKWRDRDNVVRYEVHLVVDRVLWLNSKKDGQKSPPSSSSSDPGDIPF